MAHGFDDYRVFISAPGDLEADRNACHAALSHVNETVTMPARVLLVPVGLRDNDQISAHRAIVSDNVRWSSYFIQLFEDDWGTRNLSQKLFRLAVACRADAALPMREVALFLKDAPGETDPEILAFRKELEEQDQVPVFRYETIEELRGKLDAVLRGWADELLGSKPPVSDAGGAATTS
jgi:hypothetical protein